MQKTLAQRMPWSDPAGRVSLLKLGTFMMLFVPAIWMASSSTSIDWSFPSPFVPLIYHSGLWATYLLLLGLSISPARRILGQPRLAQLRRMIGLGAFGYALLHVFAWIGLRFFDWGVLSGELLVRPSLWIASLSTLGLTALAATSYDAAMRRLGATWKQLHRTVYILTFLAILHFLMSPGSLQGPPFLMAGVFFWLMAWRLLERAGLGTNPRALAAIGIAAVVFTLLLEPVWLMTYQRDRASQSPLDALAANFDFDIWVYLGAPPIVWVSVLAILTTAAPIIRSIYSQRKYAELTGR